jgi:hypothetical protein
MKYLQRRPLRNPKKPKGLRTETGWGGYPPNQTQSQQDLLQNSFFVEEDAHQILPRPERRSQHKSPHQKLAREIYFLPRYSFH